MSLPVTFVTIRSQSQTSFFSSSIIPSVPAPTSTSAPVERVNGAEVSTMSATSVPIHSNDQDVSQHLTGPLSPDDAQATKAAAPLIVNCTSASITNALAPVTSEPAAHSTSTFVAHPFTPVSLDPAFASVAIPTPVNSGPASNSASTSVADPLAHSVVNSPASVDLEGTETRPQFTSALNIMGKLSPSGVLADQAAGELTMDISNGDPDVIMADDTDLPPYLAAMIGYLRGVAVDEAWQDLVTNFVTLEKAGHAASGVSAL